ncbi:hypothetical protein ACHAXT_009904 [Thalassiosira profunda]
MNFLQRINQRCDDSIDGSDSATVDPKLRPTVLLEESERTADADVSDRSGSAFVPDFRAPSFAGDGSSCPTGRRRRGCLKVKTQCESLARISAPKASDSHAPIVDTPDMVIRFGTVEFRQYDPVLVDSPSTSSGPPIGIDWTYHPADTLLFDLHFYEAEREGLRRNKNELSMPPYARTGVLRAAGHSREELRAATRRSQKDKERIRTSMKLQRLEPVLERVESVKFGVKRAFK